MVQMLVVSLPRVEVWVGNMRMRESGVAAVRETALRSEYSD